MTWGIGTLSVSFVKEEKTWRSLHINKDGQDPVYVSSTPLVSLTACPVLRGTDVRDSEHSEPLRGRPSQRTVLWASPSSAHQQAVLRWAGHPECEKQNVGGSQQPDACGQACGSQSWSCVSVSYLRETVILSYTVEIFTLVNMWNWEPVSKVMRLCASNSRMPLIFLMAMATFLINS